MENTSLHLNVNHVLEVAEKNNLALTDYEVMRIAVELTKASNLNDIAGSIHKFTRDDGSFQMAVYDIARSIENQLFYPEIDGPLIEIDKALNRIADKLNE